MWKLNRVKVLERFSIAQSKEYDMKLYVEYSRGFWIFKETLLFEVYRYNPVYMKNCNFRYYM